MSVVPTRGPRSKRAQRLKRAQWGIGLLETLAALVILSAGAAVMLTWFSQNATVLSRLKETEKTEQGRLVALDYVRTLNPAERPSGEVTIGPNRIVWTSQPNADAKRLQAAPGTQGRFEVLLFDVEVSLYRADADAAVLASKMKLPVAGFKVIESANANPFGGAP